MLNTIVGWLVFIPFQLRVTIHFRFLW